MNVRPLIAVVIAVLLLLGQQADLLHRLGHDLDRAAGAAISWGDAAEHGQRDADHRELCAVCVGFGVFSHSVSSAVHTLPASPALAFARPIADVRVLAAVGSTATPIRGPPLFSA